MLSYTLRALRKGLPLLALVARRLNLYNILFLSSIRNGSPQKIVFVCKGNICRSPYAEAKWKQISPDVSVSSCGIDTIEGLPADCEALRVANKRGVSLTEHKTTLCRPEVLQEADLLLLMCPMQLASGALRKHLGKCLFLGAVDFPTGGSLFIGDPYGQGPEAFELCFNRIDSALLALEKHLKGLTKK